MPKQLIKTINAIENNKEITFKVTKRQIEDENGNVVSTKFHAHINTRWDDGVDRRRVVQLDAAQKKMARDLYQSILASALTDITDKDI